MTNTVARRKTYPLPWSVIVALVLTVVALQGAAEAPIDLRLPAVEGSVRFAAIGDMGTGKGPQFEVGFQMERYRKAFPYALVLMLGDNLYNGSGPRDFVEDFERPYKALLDAGVLFYASLGNHDQMNQIHYPRFNMNGQRYYTFAASTGSVRFFALDSKRGFIDAEQVAWLEQALGSATERWKVVFLHHPLYSSGERHGDNTLPVRRALEPVLRKGGVQIVLSGHDHLYERLTPQHGIHYFVSGAGGKLRRGGLRDRSALTAAGFDADQHFMLFEIEGDTAHFQAVSREGKVVDFGRIERGVETTSPEPAPVR